MNVKSHNRKSKVVLFVGLDDKVNRLFNHLKQDGFYNENNEYNLVHIFNSESRKCLPPNINPENEEQVYEFIISKFHAVIKAFKKFRGESKEESNRKFKMEILFDRDAKLKAVTYLSSVEADSCILVTRGAQELNQFSSDSFAYYLVAHAPCDVLVLRPHD